MHTRMSAYTGACVCEHLVHIRRIACELVASLPRPLFHARSCKRGAPSCMHGSCMRTLIHCKCDRLRRVRCHLDQVRFRCAPRLRLAPRLMWLCARLRLAPRLDVGWPRARACELNPARVFCRRRPLVGVRFGNRDRLVFGRCCIATAFATSIVWGHVWRMFEAKPPHHRIALRGLC